MDWILVFMAGVMNTAVMPAQKVTKRHAQLTHMLPAVKLISIMKTMSA